jgi:hypothetical protein
MNGIVKESILVRRNGLLGLGNAGWEEFPSKKQIQIAISKVFHKYGHSSDGWVIIDDDYRDSDELQDPMPVEPGSVPLPWTLQAKTWDCVKNALSKQAGCEMAGEVEALLDGILQPVLVYEDYGLIDGEKQLLLAHSLAIPVRTFILKKIK